MDIGDVIRTRSIRAYFEGSETRGWASFKADSGRKREKQSVFVLLFLGMEKLVGEAKDALPVRRQLNALGLWGEDRLTEILGKEEVGALVERLVERVKEKEAGTEDGCQKSDSRD